MLDGVLNWDPGNDLLSHGLRPHYHRRRTFSLPSSERDRVVPARNNHQGILEVLAGASLTKLELQPIDRDDVATQATDVRICK